MPSDESIPKLTHADIVGPSQFNGEDEAGPDRNIRADLLEHSIPPIAAAATSESGTSIPIRIEDTEKAKVMADAEAPHRDEAIFEGELAHPTDDDEITSQREQWANEHIETAEEAGEEA